MVCGRTKRSACSCARRCTTGRTACKTRRTSTATLKTGSALAVRDDSSPYTDYSPPLPGLFVPQTGPFARTAAAPAGYAVGTIILWGVLAPLATSASIRHCFPVNTVHSTFPLRPPGRSATATLSYAQALMGRKTLTRSWVGAEVRGVSAERNAWERTARVSRSLRARAHACTHT